jgi:hypothetical protein
MTLRKRDRFGVEARFLVVRVAAVPRSLPDLRSNPRHNNRSMLISDTTKLKVGV